MTTNITTNRFSAPSVEALTIIPAGEVKRFLRLSCSATTFVTFGVDATSVNCYRITSSDNLEIDFGIVGYVSVRAASSTSLVYAAWA